MAQNSTLMSDELDIDAFLNPTMDDGSINAVMEPVTSLQPATLSQGTYALGDISGFELHSSSTPTYNGSQESSHDVVDLLRPTKTEGEASSSGASSTGTSFAGNAQKASLLSPTALAMSAADGMNNSAAFHNLGSMTVLNTLTTHLTHDEQATATKKANLLALATVAKKAGDKAKEVIAVMGKLQEFLTHLITLADSSGPQVKSTVQMLVQKLVAGAITEEEFATKIEQDLRSQHQPSLLPFLQKSVPHFRTKLKFQQAFMKEILQKQQQQQQQQVAAHMTTLQPQRPPHPLQQATSPLAPLLANNISPQPLLPAATTPPATFQVAPNTPMMILLPGTTPAVTAAGSPSPQPITIPLLNQQQLLKLTPEQRVAYVQQLQKLQQKGAIKLPLQIQQALFNAMPQGVSPQATTGVVATPPLSVAPGNNKLPQVGQVQVQAGTIASLQAAMEKQKLLTREQLLQVSSVGAKLAQPTLKPLAVACQQSSPLTNSSSPSPKTSFADMKLAKLGPVGAVPPLMATPTPGGGKKTKGKTKGVDDKQDAVEEEEDDEGMDIAGVNLQEEHVLPAKVSETVSRSCGDRVFLNLPALQRRIASIARKHGITDIAEDFAGLLSHATEERLRDIVEKLAVISQHRVEVLKDSEHYEVTSEVKEQLKVLEKIDRINVKRKQEREKEKLLRAAKSRSKADDPELAKIKEKAKQLQMEEEQIIRDRAANATALAALGNRRKRALEGEASSSQPVAGLTGTSSSNGGQTVANVFGSASGPRQPKRRITVRDVVFFMEGERETRKSLLLYKSLFK